VSGPALRATVLLAVSLGLCACPKNKPAPAVVKAPRPAVRPAVLQAWSGFDATLYDELRAGAPAVSWLAQRYDVGNYTPTYAAWGELPVLQLEDTDRRQTAHGAVTGWVLSAPVDAAAARHDPLGATADATVAAVVLRDFTAAPEAESPEALAAAVLPPWSLCQPAHDADLAVAFDAERGLKLGLVRSDLKESPSWSVDHVEVLAANTDPATWWSRKGYGDCAPVGVVLDDGRFRRDKNAPEPAPPADPGVED